MSDKTKSVLGWLSLALSAVIALGGVALIWADARASDARSEAHLREMDGRVTRLEVRVDDRLNRLENKIDRLLERD